MYIIYNIQYFIYTTYIIYHKAYIYICDFMYTIYIHYNLYVTHMNIITVAALQITPKGQDGQFLQLGDSKF